VYITKKQCIKTNLFHDKRPALGTQIPTFEIFPTNPVLIPLNNGSSLNGLNMQFLRHFVFIFKPDVPLTPEQQAVKKIEKLKSSAE
jgi:hypothetical protein